MNLSNLDTQSAPQPASTLANPPQTIRLYGRWRNLSCLSLALTYGLLALLPLCGTVVPHTPIWIRIVCLCMAGLILWPAYRLFRDVCSAGTFLELSPSGITVSVRHHAHSMPWTMLGGFSVRATATGGRVLSAAFVGADGRTHRHVRGQIDIPDIYGFGGRSLRQLKKQLNTWSMQANTQQAPTRVSVQPSALD